MNLTDPLIPIVGMVQFPATGKVFIDMGTSATQARRCAPSESTSNEATPVAASEITRRGAVILHPPVQAPLVGPYTPMLNSEEEYIEAEDEARAMGHTLHFQDSTQPEMTKHREIAAMLRIKKKVDRYAKELSASDLIILLREGK